jgi:hypothetical protein
MKINFPKFIVKVRKTGIKYFYLRNLALEGEMFWVRTEYNKEFLSATGPLNSTEKIALKNFKKIILSFDKNQNSSLLTCAFFNARPWWMLKTKLNKKDYQTVIWIFKIFENRWNFFWGKHLMRLAFDASKALTLNLKKNKVFISKTIRNLSILYGQPKLPEVIPVFLIPLPKTLKGIGGQYLQVCSAIILEASIDRVKEQRALEILLHELAHLCFETSFYYEKIEQIQKSELIKSGTLLKTIRSLQIPSLTFLIKEIIATAATINLTQTFSLKKPSYPQLRDNIAYKIKPFIEKYIKEKKQIDYRLIKKVIVLLKKQLKQLRV